LFDNAGEGLGRAQVTLELPSSRAAAAHMFVMASGVYSAISTHPDAVGHRRYSRFIVQLIDRLLHASGGKLAPWETLTVTVVGTVTEGEKNEAHALEQYIQRELVRYGVKGRVTTRCWGHLGNVDSVIEAAARSTPLEEDLILVHTQSHAGFTRDLLARVDRQIWAVFLPKPVSRADWGTWWAIQSLKRLGLRLGFRKAIRRVVSSAHKKKH